MTRIVARNRVETLYVDKNRCQEGEMAERKQSMVRAEVDPKLVEALAKAQGRRVTEDELHEQRISFAFGQAMNLDKITKETVRTTAQRVRLKA